LPAYYPAGGGAVSIVKFRGATVADFDASAASAGTIAAKHASAPDTAAPVKERRNKSIRAPVAA